MSSPADAQRIIVGKVQGLYGVSGWVKVYSYTKPIVNILTYSPWQLYINQAWVNVLVQAGREHGKGIIAKLEGCDDRNQAMAWLGAEIAIDRQQLPPTAADEYYWSDLMGLTVINQDNEVFGKVDYLFETGANDVMVVKGERERLIPYLPGQVVQEIDLSTRTMRVIWDSDF